MKVLNFLFWNVPSAAAKATQRAFFGRNYSSSAAKMSTTHKIAGMALMVLSSAAAGAVTITAVGFLCTHIAGGSAITGAVVGVLSTPCMSNFTHHLQASVQART